MKLSSAAGIAIESAQLAHEGVCILTEMDLSAPAPTKPLPCWAELPPTVCSIQMNTCKEIIDRESACKHHKKDR